MIHRNNAHADLCSPAPVLHGLCLGERRTTREARSDDPTGRFHSVDARQLSNRNALRHDRVRHSHRRCGRPGGVFGSGAPH